MKAKASFIFKPQVLSLEVSGTLIRKSDGKLTDEDANRILQNLIDVIDGDDLPGVPGLEVETLSITLG